MQKYSINQDRNCNNCKYKVSDESSSPFFYCTKYKQYSTEININCKHFREETYNDILK